MKNENLLKQGKKALMTVLIASSVCGLMAPSYHDNRDTKVTIVQNTNRTLASNSTVEIEDGSLQEVNSINEETLDVNNEESSIDTESDIITDSENIPEKTTDDTTIEEPTITKDEVKSSEEVTKDSETQSNENLSEEEMNLKIKKTLESLGIKDVNTDDSEALEKKIVEVIKEQFSEQLLKRIPYAGEFIADLFNKATSTEEIKEDAVVTELKNIKTCLEQIDKDLLDIDTKNNLQSQIDQLNALIECHKLVYDTYDNNLDKTIEQLNIGNSSMNSFKEGVFANIYSVGAKKEIIDEETGKYVVKPTSDTQYLDDFINLTKGLLNIKILNGLNEKNGSVIDLQNKIYTYNYDFNTQTFKVRQQNIDDLKNLCYGRYNHLLTAIEFARSQQSTQYDVYAALANCYIELLESKSLNDAQRKVLETKLNNAIAARDKAETLKAAVEGHLTELNTYKNEFTNMIDAAQKALDEESSKNVAHCYRNNVDYKKIAQSFNSRDLLDENKLLNDRNNRIDIGLDFLTGLGADYKYKSETKNSIQYTKGSDANIDYLITLAKNRNMDLTTYIDSVFDVQGVVTSMQKADGLYKTGAYVVDTKNTNHVENVTTYTDKSGNTVKTIAGVTFENEDGTIKRVGKFLLNILSCGQTNLKNHVKIKSVDSVNKVLVRIEAA